MFASAIVGNASYLIDRASKVSTLVASEQRVMKYALVVIVNRRQVPALNWNGIIHRMIEIQTNDTDIW